VNFSEESPAKALEKLLKRKKELEKELEVLLKRKEKGEISEEEFSKQKRNIEKEYIEIMDRIAQLKYLASLWG